MIYIISYQNMQCPVESPRLFFAGIPLCAVSPPEIPCLSPRRSRAGRGIFFREGTPVRAIREKTGRRRGSSKAFRWRVFSWTATGKTKWRRSAQQNAYNDARPAPKRCGPFLRRAVTDVSVRRYRSLILDRIRSSKSCCRPL